MNVLSLFDGMSCGQIALERAGIKVDSYFASEIKPHARIVTHRNYPNTVQLGDVRSLNVKSLPHIHLLIGGSPCQDLSGCNATRDGLKGDKSQLFYEYVRIKKELKPDNYLLENVWMEKPDYRIISDVMGTEPVRINSNLVSAQLRDRLYWTDIGEEDFDLFGNRISRIDQPKNKHIHLKDVLENGFTDRLKSRALLESDSRPLTTPSKMYRRYKEKGFTTIVFEDESLDWEKGVRYLSQIELERLQTVPEGYTSMLNRNDAASLLGDGWTVDVIVHILKLLYVRKDKT